MLNAKRFVFLLTIIVVLAVYAAYLYFDVFDAWYLVGAIGGIIILLLIQPGIRRSFQRRHQEKAAYGSKRLKAKIIDIVHFPDDSNTSEIVLRLMVNFNNPDEAYLSAYVIHKPNNEQEDYVEKGKILTVYKDPHEEGALVIPEIYSRRTKPKSTLILIRDFWWTVLPFSGAAAPIIIVFITYMFPSKSENSGLEYISSTPETVWEISYSRDWESPYDGSYYINIYDPLADDELEEIKMKKASIPGNFYVIQNAEKVWVIAEQEGVKPIIDVFDANTHEQIGDLETFSQMDPALKEGILSLNFLILSDHYTVRRSNIIELITNDGEKVYFDLTSEKFYTADEDLDRVLWQNDSMDVCAYGYSYLLAYEDDERDVMLLHMLEATGPDGNKDVWEYGGTAQNLDNSILFRKNKLEVKTTDLSHDRYFLNGRIIYQDHSLIAIYHSSKLRKGSDVQISILDSLGRTLISINQSEFPNPEDFTRYAISNGFDNNLTPSVTRNNEHLVFLFEFPDAKGALCYDIENSRILWKHEVVNITESDE